MTADSGGYRGLLIAELERQAGACKNGLEERLPTLVKEPLESLPVPPAARREVWESRRLVGAAGAQDVLRRAEEDLGSAWPLPRASEAARIYRDGNRDSWEREAFARQHRLSRAVVAAAVTLTDRWLDQVADGVQLLCEQSSWCWPAHDNVRETKGSVLADVTDPYLDLGAGEVAAQLTWIDSLLGKQLDTRYPGMRKRIRHEVMFRVLLPFERRRDWHWLGLDGDVHNWNPWIHSNVLVTVLGLLDTPEQQDRRLRILLLVIEGLDRYVSALPADGGIDEGYAYWWNGACRALEAFDVLAHATGGALDPRSAIQGLRETVAFPHRMHLGGDWYLNLADGQARPSGDQPWQALYRAAERVGDTAARDHSIARHRAAGGTHSEINGLGRLLRGMTDIAFLSASTATSPLPRDIWLPSTQVLISRARARSASGLAVCTKGGHNGEHHNHNDVGSMVVTTGGVPVIVDAGRPTYELSTFGPDRYRTWTMQSSWHNVPEVRGTPQPHGAAYAASSVDVKITEAKSSLALDLTSLYPVPGLRSWHRSVTLDRAIDRVVVDDVWCLEPWTGPGTESPTILHLLIAGDVTLHPGFADIIPLNEAPLVRLRWPVDIPAALTERELTDPMLSDVWGPSLTRLELDVTGCDSISVSVENDREGKDAQ